MGNANLACIEVGGSGSQTVTFDLGGRATFTEGVHEDGAEVIAVAVPGIVADGRVVAASNLGWYDVDPAEALGLGRGVCVVLNDGEAAGLGEAHLRATRDLTIVMLGTGVGGAVIRDEHVIADNLFGHAPGFSDRTCRCGSVGCLETVAAGWALPDPIGDDDIASVASAVATAIGREMRADTELVVVAGGLARRYPALVPAIAAGLPGRSIEPTAAPSHAKSAVAWGLRRAIEARELPT